MLILLQVSIEQSSQLLLVTFFILIILTLLLLLGSLYLRGSHFAADKKISELENRFYPMVLDHLEGIIPAEKILSSISGKNIEYAVLEKVIKDLIDQLQGDEALKLKELLSAGPLFNFHLKQLQARSDIEKIKACNYFSKTKLINDEVIGFLESLMDDPNRMVAYSAASALMATHRVKVRAGALKSLARRFRISEMAVLELLYEFKNSYEDQNKEETEELYKIVLSSELPPDNRAVIILGTSEINYAGLGELYYQLLKSENQTWNYIKVKEALILAQGYYFNLDATDDLIPYLDDNRPTIKRAAINVLSKFQSPRIIQLLLGHLSEKNPELNLFIIENLMKEGCDGETILAQAPVKDSASLSALINIVEHEMS
ncbi:HEAT repeat domain-containing protein [Balneola sp. MJW-20]|uniref:HEAT repeat domain-containing protein n=1 Tax=Gracilimonas aurantiaca TaxID=3234185 RepID=UPI0034659894